MLNSKSFQNIFSRFPLLHRGKEVQTPYLSILHSLVLMYFLSPLSFPLIKLPLYKFDRSSSITILVIHWQGPQRFEGNAASQGKGKLLVLSLSLCLSELGLGKFAKVFIFSNLVLLTICLSFSLLILLSSQAILNLNLFWNVPTPKPALYLLTLLHLISWLHSFLSKLLSPCLIPF